MYRVMIAYTTEGMILNIYQQLGPDGGRWNIAKHIDLIFEEVIDGQIHQPTLSMNHMQGEFFLGALREALEPLSLKREKEIKMKERIKALEENLEDLRQILKINTDPKRLIRM